LIVEKVRRKSSSMKNAGEEGTTEELDSPGKSRSYSHQVPDSPEKM